MFVSILPPIGSNQQRAPYLWVMYKQLTHFTPDELALIGTAEYFEDPTAHLDTKRWDLSDASQEYAVFDIPTKERINSYPKALLPDTLASALKRDTGDHGVAVRRLLNQRVAEFEDALRKAIGELARTGPRIDGFLSWCRIPSLLAVASELDIPVIHNELGPLRGPDYYWTAYLDFQGVNGGTEAQARFGRFRAAVADSGELLATRDELLSLFSMNANQPLSETGVEFEIGLALQVENDSNLIAFADGWDNQRLIDEAGKLYTPQEILVRRHPAGLRDYAEECGAWDHSTRASDFIRRCRRIATINSSLGLETMLWGRPAVILGDSPFAFAAQRSLDSPFNESAVDDTLVLNFFLLGYLIPYEFLYEQSYFRWRLQAPDEIDIYRRHRDYVRARKEFLKTGHRFRLPLEKIESKGLINFKMLKEQRDQLETRRIKYELEQTRSEKLSIEASFSWRLTSLFRMLGKLLNKGTGTE